MMSEGDEPTTPRGGRSSPLPSSLPPSSPPRAFSELGDDDLLDDEDVMPLTDGAEDEEEGAEDLFGDGMEE